MDFAEVTWQAPEFIQHQKGIGWYFVLGGITAVLALASYWATDGDIFASASIVVALIVLASFAARAAKDRTYSIDEDGVYIDDKLHPYGEMQSFSIVHDGAQESIYLLPAKRFAAPLSLYVPVEKGEEVISVLEQYLPYDERDVSFVEILMNRLKF